MAGQAACASSTRENTNYARLCRLLIDMGTSVLRYVFNGIHSPDKLHKILLSSSPHYTTLMRLRQRRVLNTSLWEKLSTLTSREFDISLLVVLLRNICGLSPPASTGSWDQLPPDDDNSTEANIVRIKCYRNEVYAHASKASVDDLTFNKLWKSISNAIIGLASEEVALSYATAIDNLRDECMDPDREAHFRNLLDYWKKYDDDTKKILEELKGMMQAF
ncbi:E3 ubiquitin-protein ligase DZIP3-like [Acropora millepora]|uniref:E3 ubiquitin-protein ligase DZIP3-like n=1 Tax=Acropora millepora TaxID=45264 RepID=UPI001CF32954|nr:E3 ubiquitin-protein ligase DZIP3-like [Acropora millepora]